MSQIRTSSLVLATVLSLFLMALSGCGDKNSQANLEPGTGKHSADWLPGGHKAAATANILGCTACHGEDYAGGISKVSCSQQTGFAFTCHATSPAATSTGCTSCHGGPPSGPFGTAAPNRNLAHSVHTPLLTGCSTCHFNAGSGTANHAKAPATGGFNRATMSFATFVNTASPAAFNAASSTCSNVSCHGGQVTPVWAVPTAQTNLLVADDNSKCLTCHEAGPSNGIPQYNSFYSGVSTTNAIPNLHTFHIVDMGRNCTECHNIGKLTDYQLHFGGVTTKSFTLPERTIGNDNPDRLATITGPTKLDAYLTPTKTCVNVACHPAQFPARWIQ